ncbi:MAG: ArsA-related P-loop ATPase [Acidimicrobiales bacterium]
MTRLLIVAGKGGVGKTTVTAAVAAMASAAGLTTCIIEIEGKSGLGEMFGRPGRLTHEQVVLRPGGGPGGAADVVARTLDPEAALVEYLEDHGLRRISKRLAATGAIDVAATAAPGIKDILVLGKVKQLERAGEFDLLLLDAPAAGHALTFLTSARGLLDAVRVGPIRAQAEDVLELLADPVRCQVLLVTLAEETPVNEVVETAFALEDRVGISLAPVVVNGLYDVVDLAGDAAAAAAGSGVTLAPSRLRALDAAAAFRRQRQEMQAEQVARLRDALPLPQLRLPYVFSGEVGPAEVDLLAAALAGSVAGLP